MRTSLKAGFIQFNPALGKKEDNQMAMGKLIGSGRDADLLVLPELANTGYNFESIDQALALAEPTDASPFIEFLEKEARAYDLFLVAGMCEVEDGALYNTSVLVGPEGYLGKYRKIHLFWDEFDFFDTGNAGLPVFDIGGVTIGMLICFDWVFPEVWRILALKGADIICHPSNLVLPYAQQAVPVHGMINRNFVITANRYGTEREVTFSGMSIITDTQGKTLVTAEKKRDEVQWVELDLTQARNKQITPRNHLFDDRLPEYYQTLCTG